MVHLNFLTTFLWKIRFWIKDLYGQQVILAKVHRFARTDYHQFGSQIDDGLGPDCLIYHARPKLETGQSLLAVCALKNVPFCLFELWPLLLKAEKRLRCNACSEDFVGGILTRICGSSGASNLGSENFVNCILKECNFLKDSFVVQ